MPTYTIEHPDGRVINMEGDAPPSESDIDSAFDVVNKAQPKAEAKAPVVNEYNPGGESPGNKFRRLTEGYLAEPGAVQLPESFMDPTAGMPTTDQFRAHYKAVDRANRPTKADLREQQMAIANRKSVTTVPNATGGFNFVNKPGDTPGSFSVIDQYLTALDPIKGVLRTGQKGVGHLMSGLSALASSIPPNSGEIPAAPGREEAWAKRQAMSPEQRRQLDRSDPFAVAGQALAGTADEVHPAGDPDSIGNKIGEAIGGFVPMVFTGPAAPFVFGLQAAGATLEEKYYEEIASGKSPDEAAETASKAALAEGAFQGLFMKYFPHQARKLGDAGIDALFGKVLNEASVKRFLAGRVAQLGEGAAFGAGSAVGSNIIQGREVGTGLMESATGMGLIQAALKRGATKGEIKSHNEHVGRMVAEKNRILKAHEEDLVRPEHKDELTGQLKAEQKRAYFDELPDGTLAMPDKRGNIVIDQRQLANALAELPTDSSKSQLIKSLITEEAVHIASKKENGLKFFNLASKAEQVLAMKQYWGETTGKNIGYKDRLAEASKDPAKLETFKANMGLEMMRSKLQELQKMTPTQIAMEFGTKQTGIAHLLSMENMIWKMRSAFSKGYYSKNSPIDQQRRILEETADKLAKAREVVIEKLPEKIPPAEPVRISEPAAPAGESIPTTPKIEAARARLAELKAKQAAQAAPPVEAKPAVVEQPVAAAEPPPKPAPQEGINPNWKLDTSDYPARREIDPDNEPFANKPAAFKKITESDIEKMSQEEIAKYGKHDYGINYGLTLKRSDIPHLEEQYAKAGSDMAKAFAGTFDEAAHQIAFGKYSFYGGALAGVTRGEHKAAAGNFDIFKKRNPEVVEAADWDQEIGARIENLRNRDIQGENPQAYKKGMSQKQFLAEKERQLKAAFLAAKGEEIPPHLASAGMPKNVGGERQSVPEELRVGSGFKHLDIRDVNEAAVDELGRDITEKASSREYELKPGKRGDVPETYTDLEGNPHYEKRVKVDVKYDRPNFDRFATRMKEAATNLSNEELVAIWTDKVWSRLIKATPERLSQLRKALGLEGRFGRRVLGEDPLGKSEIAPHADPQNLDVTKAAERRRAVLEKRIDKLEELSKKKLEEANEWADSVSDEDLAKYKDELFGPPGKGQVLRKQASDLRYQVQMLRYALSKASNETLAKAYTKGIRQPKQQPLGSLTAQTKALAGERSKKLLEEAKTASPERTKQIDAELQRLAQMVKRAERVSEASGPDTPAERTGEAGTAMAGYRNKVIRAIAHQLIGEAYRSAKEKADVNRRSIDSEDLDFTNKKSKAGVYYEITGGDLEMQKDDVQIPYRLKTVLRDQARGKNTDLESASRRLLAVEAADGTVHLLSVYNDGGTWRVTDPNFTGEHKPYRELSMDFLAKHKPFASLLLKDPVKGLNHIFDNRSKFMDEMGQEAKDRSEVGDELQDDFLAASMQQIEGTHGIEGEMGSFQGPKKGMIDYSPRDPVLQANRPLSRNEAFAVSRYKNRMDVLSRLGELAQKVESKDKLTPKDIVEISGFRKIANAIEKSSKRDPELTSDPIRDFVELSGLVASTIANSHGFGNPVKTLLRSYGQKKPGTFAPERQKSELTMRGDIRPPTSQKEFAGPFQRAEAPGAEVGVRSPKAYIPESVSSEPPRQTEAEAYEGRKYDVTQNWAAAERGKRAGQEELRNKAMKQRERILRKYGKLMSKEQAAMTVGYEGPMAFKKNGEWVEPSFDDVSRLIGFKPSSRGTPTPGSMLGSHDPMELIRAVEDGRKPVAIFGEKMFGLPEGLEAVHITGSAPHGESWAVVKKGNEDAINELYVALASTTDYANKLGKALGFTKAERDDYARRNKMLDEYGELEFPNDFEFRDNDAPESKEQLKFDFPAAFKKGLPQDELPDNDPMKFGWIGMPTDNADAIKKVRAAFKVVENEKDPEQALIKAIQLAEFMKIAHSVMHDGLRNFDGSFKELAKAGDQVNEIGGKILQIAKKIAELEDRDSNLAPRFPEELSGDLDFIQKLENQREFREKLSGSEEQSFAAAHKKSWGKVLREEIPKHVAGIGSWFDEPLIQAMERHGGDVAKEGAMLLRGINENFRKYRGELAATVDPASIKATGTEMIPGIRQTPTPKAMKDAQWANKLYHIPGAKSFAATPNWFWNLAVPNHSVPRHAEGYMATMGIANLDIGKMFEHLGTKFEASGKPQNNLTWEGFDVFSDMGGDIWRKWTAAIYQANKRHVEGLTIAKVREDFRAFKELLDKPDITGALLKKVNQDMQKKYPRPVTHIKSNGVWHELIHANAFGYLQRGADRAAYTKAFREVFPNTEEGVKKLTEFREGIVNELNRNAVEEFDQVLKRIQGRPDFNYENLPFLKPTNPIGQLFRLADATVGNLLVKSVLSGQMILQPSELVSGATPIFLGSKNTLEAAKRLTPGANPMNWIKDMARVRQLYSEMEKFGQVNPVMMDFSMHEGSAIRSASKIAGNTISKVFMEHLLNEWQETLAATTANVVAEKLSTGSLSAWEKRMLPETFRAMGFNADENYALMHGDKLLMDEFRRKAASFLTGGNRSLTDASRLGSNPHFNTMFRFMTYPMTRIRQFRQVSHRLVDSWANGTAKEKRAATEMFARNLVFGANQGMLSAAIAAMAYGGLSGLNILLNESKDKPAKFMFDSFMTTVMGPLNQIRKGIKSDGITALPETMARLSFPFSATEDLAEFATRTGRYQDKSWSRAIATLLRSKNPALRAIKTGLSLVGLAAKDEELEAAMAGYGRWRQDKFGSKNIKDNLVIDPNKDFRIAIGDAVDAFRNGDEKAFYKAYDKAVDLRNDLEIKDSIREKFNSKKVLKNGYGGKLTEDELDELRKRIGNAAVDKLEDYNAMLEEAGKGLFIPIDER